MLALIDGDLIAFRCAATCENETEMILNFRIDDAMDRVLGITGAIRFYVYLTGHDNFRKVIDPSYKANRKDKEPPRFLQKAKEYLTYRWKAITCEGFEADDALGIEQCQNPEKSVICSLDKDLLMIPGEHYNWVKDIFTVVNNQQGLQHFYKQLLIGDSSDNVKGIHGIGPVKAAKLINSLDTELDMFDLVRSKYNDDERLISNCNLLWIMQDRDELWVHRSKHLLTHFGLTELAQEVLSPLKLSQIHEYLVHGMMGSSGTEHGGTKTEATDSEKSQAPSTEEAQTS